jgi:hypothetical protein
MAIASKHQLAQIDNVATSMGLPSYTDLMNAFCDLMDGESYHDLPNTGLNEKDCQRIEDAHRALKDTWIAGFETRD